METNSSSYKYYKSSYNKLVNKDFIFEYKLDIQGIESIYNFIDKEKGTPTFVRNDEEHILIFIKENDGISIKLNGGKSEYIHNGSLTYLDPYTLYWYIKFKKWFNENKKDFTKTFDERFCEVYPILSVNNK